MSGTAPNVTYTPNPDYTGSDSFKFRVNDRTTNSTEATVTINVTPVNDPPTADISAPGTVAVSDNVKLDGSSSTDPEGQALTYQWTLMPPLGSNATLDDVTAVTPSFTADVAGDYGVRLVVSDGDKDSAPATATVTAN